MKALDLFSGIGGFNKGEGMVAYCGAGETATSFYSMVGERFGLSPISA